MKHIKEILICGLLTIGVYISINFIPNNYNFFIVKIFCLMAGGYIIYITTKGYVRIKNKDKLIRTVGKIIDSKIKSNGSESSYLAKVEYEYIVDGIKYISENFYLTGVNPSQNDSSIKKELYIKGSKVNVYYDFKNPKLACLNTTAQYWKLGMLFLFGILFIILILLFHFNILKLKQFMFY